MEPDDKVLFFEGNVPSLDVGPQVVQPTEPAALATPLKPCAEDMHACIVKYAETRDGRYMMPAA